MPKISIERRDTWPRRWWWYSWDEATASAYTGSAFTLYGAKRAARKALADRPAT